MQKTYFDVYVALQGKFIQCVFFILLQCVDLQLASQFDKEISQNFGDQIDEKLAKLLLNQNECENCFCFVLWSRSG